MDKMSCFVCAWWHCGIEHEHRVV